MEEKVVEEGGKSVMGEEGMDGEKWVVRMRKMLSGYMEGKLGGSVIKGREYVMMRELGGEEMEEEEKIGELMKRNVGGWEKNVGDGGGYYVIEYNEKRMEEVGKEGNVR